MCVTESLKIVYDYHYYKTIFGASIFYIHRSSAKYWHISQRTALRTVAGQVREIGQDVSQSLQYTTDTSIQTRTKLTKLF
jgi:hypothetical protein